MSSKSLPPSTRKDALIDPTGTYRYWLTREWATTGPRICWVMLNPSTADAEVDDPTIRRCVGFSKALGARGLVVVNLFALRATKPAALRTAADPVGPDNDQHIFDYATRSVTIITAWGANGGLAGRGESVLNLLRGTLGPIHHLGLTKDGHPRHPLYVAGNTRLTAW